MCLHQSLQAQPQPVSATLQIIPPYSVYLSDYALPGSEQMKLHLLLRDLAEPEYPVRLHLTVEGAGIRIETSPSFMPPPIMLQGGVPALLTASDLAPYLHSRNLLFSGITLQQYEKRGALPEGFYRFTFRVLDYRRQDIVLSNAASFMAWFVLNDPPRINTPLCGTTLKLADPQTILFQWMPGNAGSPNSMLDTEYELTLVEVRPKGRNPNDALLSTVPLYQATTPYTSLIYGLSEPALIPGQQYAFRVQARDQQERDLFKNQGYSEVCTFTYGEVAPLEPPEFVHVYAGAERRAQVSWQMSISPDSYRVEYRKQPGKGEEHAWFQKETDADQVTLYDLEPATTYEVRVASLFRTFASRYTRVQTFTTPERKVIACGEAPAPHLSAGTQPLLTAIAGQYWKVGDFEMQLLEVRGGNGTFSGMGSMHIPYLGFQVPVQFEAVKVNQDRELVWGEVVAIREDVTTFRERWQETHPEPSGPPASGEEEKAADDTQAQVLPDPTTSAFTNITIAGTIAVVQVDEGEILITDTEGRQTTYKQAEDAGSGEKKETLITDAAGNTYKVDQDGKVSEESGKSGDNTHSSAAAQSDPLLEKQDALIAAVLEEFEGDLEAWLRVNGKGPLDRTEMSALLGLPGYVPQDAEMVEGIQNYVSQMRKAPTALTKMIREGETERTVLDDIAQNLDISQPIKKQLEEEEWKEVKTMASTAATDAGLLDWFTEKPYWERAAYVMEEYLEDQDIYERVWKECNGSDCKVLAELKLSEEAALTQEITFGSHFTSEEIFDLLVFTYQVPFWEAKQAFTDGFWETAVNWVRIQEDKIARQEGWAVAYANFVADVVNAPYGAVHGWVTGEHWRTGEELAWWEHALGILDVVPGEALAKVGITALVIKIGGKTIDLAKVSQATRQFIVSARAAGLRLVVRTADEIILYGRQGTRQMGRFANGILQDIYWVYGGEKILARLAGVKYLVDNKTAEGTLEVVEAAGRVGFRATSRTTDLNALAGKATKGGENLLDINAPVGKLRQLKGISGSTYRGADFWKQSGNDFIHFISQDAKYYIKHDPNTGRMLFIDVENRKFLGYGLDQDGLIKGNYDKLLDNLKTIHGLPGGQRVIKLKNGELLHLADDKANIFLGKNKPNEIPGVSGEVGTNDIIEELTILRNYSFADDGFELRPGSVHVLNIPSGNVSAWGTFFKDFNKEYLDLAIENPSKAQLTLITYPHEKLMYKWNNGLQQINDTDGLFIPSGYAMEVKYLKGKGMTEIKLKEGSIFNLNQIDIDNMDFDWTDWPY